MSREIMSFTFGHETGWLTLRALAKELQEAVEKGSWHQVTILAQAIGIMASQVAVLEQK